MYKLCFHTSMQDLPIALVKYTSSVMKKYPNQKTCITIEQENYPSQPSLRWNEIVCTVHHVLYTYELLFQDQVFQCVGVA